LRLMLTTVFFVSTLLAGFFVFGEGLNAQEDVQSAHLAVKNPAQLTPDEANTIYDGLKSELAERYALSGEDSIVGYQSWKLYNIAPYLSSTHGRRYINSYANDLGKDYGNLASEETYPEGTVFAKDSMTVTETRDVFPAALFVMEKLKAGTSPEFADWRYYMVLPDGSVFADSTGNSPDGAVYCHECHSVVAEEDYVFFVLKKHRLQDK